MAEQRSGGILWTDTTWNPTRGCSRVSPGCEHCYAETMAGRFCGPGQPYEGLVRIGTQGARWTGKIRLIPEHLADPLRWKRPRRVFVNSMSDLFHEALSNEDIAAVFGVMAASPTHTFQVLTKRAARMCDWFSWVASRANPTGATFCALYPRGRAAPGDWSPEHYEAAQQASWPLPNVWLGVSVENQRCADERIPLLLETPTAVRFVSAEPLLGPVVLQGYTEAELSGAYDPSRFRGWLAPFKDTDPSLTPTPRLSWIIAGCESGPGARPTHPDWYRSLRDQCAEGGTPFFLKQAKSEPDCSCGHAQRDHNDFEGCCRDCLCTASPSITASTWSTTKAGGVIAAPYLDGRQHLEFPR